ncbi:MAG: fused MFS/spermidine synthase [Nitrososphaerales archaeon]
MQLLGIERSKYFPMVLRIQVLTAGASVMILELLGSRLLAPYYGSTLFVWGSLIGVVMAGLSIGYWYGGKRADINPSYSAFSLLIFGAGVYTLFLTIVSADIFRFVLALNLGERYGPLAAAMLVLGIPSLLLGAVSPFAIKLSTASLARVGRTAGNIYSLSTVGSIIGTFATAFILVPALGVSTILYSLSTVLIVVSLVGLANRFRAISVVVISISLVFSAAGQASAGGIIYEKETLYHRLIVQDNTISGTRTLLLDNHFHSAMDLRDPDRIVFQYTKYFHLGPAFSPEIMNVLFIGGGGFSGPKQFLRDYPNMNIDVVEVDPEVIRVAKEYFLVPESPHLRVFAQDGRTFLSETDRIYDLIILDAYAKSYVPFHLMTREFHELAFSRMSDDGILISNMITSLTGRTSDLFRAELKTMQDIFSSIKIYPVSGDAGGIVQNVMVLAQKDGLELDIDAVRENANSVVKIDLNDILDRQYISPIDNVGSVILTDDFAPVENFLNPLTGSVYLKEIILSNNTVVTATLEVTPTIEPFTPNIQAISQILIISFVGFVVLLSINFIYSASKPRFKF